MVVGYVQYDMSPTWFLLVMYDVFLGSFLPAHPMAVPLPAALHRQRKRCKRPKMQRAPSHLKEN